MDGYEPLDERLTILYRGPAGELQLRLPVLPVRQAARHPGAAARRPRRAGAVRRLGGASADEPALGAVHPVGRGAGPVLVPRRAGAAVSRLPHVERVAIQTNLSCRLDWMADADPAPAGAVGDVPPGPGARTSGSWPAARELAAAGSGSASASSACPSTSTRPGALRAELPARRVPVGQRRRGHARTTTPRRPPGPRSTRCSATAVARTAAGACRAAPATRSISVRRRRARCAAATSCPSRWATSTTARTAARAAPPGRAPTRSATATSATCTWSRSASTTSSTGGILERIPRAFPLYQALAR